MDVSKRSVTNRVARLTGGNSQAPVPKGEFETGVPIRQTENGERPALDSIRERTMTAGDPGDEVPGPIDCPIRIDLELGASGRRFCERLGVILRDSGR